MEELTKLKIGIKVHYEDAYYDEETGNLIPESVLDSGLTLEEYDLCVNWLGYYQDYRYYDSVNCGCECGCGGDTLDLDEVDEMEEFALKEMERIEKLLGEPPSEYLA